MTDVPLLAWGELLALRSLQLPGEPDIIAELATTFVDESAAVMASARRAAARGDRLEFQARVHRLHGSAAMVCAERLRQAAGQLEQALRGATDGDYRTQIDELERLLAETVAELCRVPPRDTPL